MNLKGNKFVRFEDWHSDKSISPTHSTDALFSRRVRPSMTYVMESIRRGFEMGSERIRSFRKPLTIHPFRKKTENVSGSWKKILNPQGSFLQNWNKIFLLTCIVALALDPLFFYIPVVDGQRKCLNLDVKLEITACVLRTFVDAFYIIHMIFQFRTGFIAPSSRVFGRGEVIDDPWIIAKKYLLSYFIVDALAILPLPQFVILFIIPTMKGPIVLATKETLKVVIFLQYLPRIYRIYPLYKEVKRTSGIVTETAWAGAALNLFLYMLASHVLGALWYLIAVERENGCWRNAARQHDFLEDNLYCGGDRRKANYFPDPNLLNLLSTSCAFIDPAQITNSSTFNYGIFYDALQSGIVETWDFPQKFFFCFWWGLRNLSSLGQNLKTSTFVGDIIFAIIISISGLVLFALLIGNMQKYLQSTGVRIEEMRVKRRDAEQWMSHRMLPENIRERIRRYEQYKWQETKGVEEETLIRCLPRDLRRDIKRHLCLDLLMKVPMFEKMDEQLLDAMCDRLRPVLYTDKSYIVREGDPVEEMLFIMRGNLVSTTTNGGRTGFFNLVHLKASDFCGEALLTWALDPQSSSIPISTRTVQAVSEVEAFALLADDLRFIATQFRRLNSKQLQHTFRLYSVQWRTWAACFIQAAWRRYFKRKLVKSLREEEVKLQDALAKGSAAATSLGATIYASRFAANALRNLRQHSAPNPRLAQRLPILLPQKPTEPDFTASDS